MLKQLWHHIWFIKLSALPILYRSSHHLRHHFNQLAYFSNIYSQHLLEVATAAARPPTIGAISKLLLTFRHFRLSSFGKPRIDTFVRTIVSTCPPRNLSRHNDPKPISKAAHESHRETQSLILTPNPPTLPRTQSQNATAARNRKTQSHLAIAKRNRNRKRNRKTQSHLAVANAIEARDHRRTVKSDRRTHHQRNQNAFTFAPTIEE